MGVAMRTEYHILLNKHSLHKNQGGVWELREPTQMFFDHFYSFFNRHALLTGQVRRKETETNKPTLLTLVLEKQNEEHSDISEVH